MKKNKEIWIDSVLRSMEGSTTVTPRAYIFDDIQKKIDQIQVKTLETNISWRNVAAIGVLLLAANCYFLTQVDSLRNTGSDFISSNTVDDSQDYSLVTNYKLYE